MTHAGVRLALAGATLPNGSGRLFLFPDETGVRVACPGFMATSHFIEGRGLTMNALRAKQEICETGNDACKGRGWTAAKDGWEDAAVEIGATVFRTWWDRQQDEWVAEVRLVAVHLPSSIAVGDTAEEARLLALYRAADMLGVELPNA